VTVIYASGTFRKGRTTVMGIATLLIIWFHSALLVNPDSFMGRFKHIGDIGVDMFLFASGAGVYFALKKHGRFWPYLRSRLFRVLPAYLMVAIPWFAYQDIMLGGSRKLFLKDITMISFWLDGRMTFWYISAILLLYIVTPAYMKLCRRFRNLDKISICVLYGIVLLVPEAFLNHLVGPAMIFLPRIPIYLAGLSFGKAMEQGRVFRLKAIWLFVIIASSSIPLAAAMGWLPWKLSYVVKYVAFGPLAVILSMACSKIPENRFTGYFGHRSLEIYLLLEKVQVTLGDHREMEPFMEHGAIPFFVLAFGITLVLTELLHVATGLFRKRFFGVRLLDIPSKQQ